MVSLRLDRSQQSRMTTDRGRVTCLQEWVNRWFRWQAPISADSANAADYHARARQLIQAVTQVCDQVIGSLQSDMDA